MTLPVPQPGLVIRYSYLWRSEAARGRREGSKDRPCAVVLAMRQSSGRLVVLVAPITHTPPTSVEESIELPAPTKQRLGLDEARSWIVVDDLNYFSWPGMDLRFVDHKHPAKGIAYGYLPERITRQLILAVRATMRSRQASPVDRDS